VYFNIRVSHDPEGLGYGKARTTPSSSVTTVSKSPGVRQNCRVSGVLTNRRAGSGAAFVREPPRPVSCWVGRGGVPSWVSFDELLRDVLTDRPAGDVIRKVHLGNRDRDLLTSLIFSSLTPEAVGGRSNSGQPRDTGFLLEARQVTGPHIRDYLEHDARFGDVLAAFLSSTVDCVSINASITGFGNCHSDRHPNYSFLSQLSWTGTVSSVHRHACAPFHECHGQVAYPYAQHRGIVPC